MIYPNQIKILNDLPQYYIEVDAYLKTYTFSMPYVYIESDIREQLYISLKNIPKTIKNIDISRNKLNANIFTGIEDESLQYQDDTTIIKLFIKFDTKSEMLKWKLKNV